MKLSTLKDCLLICLVTMLMYQCSFKNKEIEASDIVWKDDVPYKRGETKAFNGTIVWLASNGKIEKKIDYEDGVIDGMKYTYYENGNLKSKVEMKHGLENGIFYDFYENGNKWAETTFKNGVRDGDEQDWYEDGKIKVKCTYKNGKKEGDFTAWHPNSKIAAKGFFENGYLKNFEDAKTFWDNGNIAEEAKIVGQKYLSIFQYDENGKNIHKMTQGTTDNHFELDFTELQYSLHCNNCGFAVGGQKDF